jgi:LAGLIDADG DNA endonuclease family protein
MWCRANEPRRSVAYRVRSKEHLLQRIIPFFVQHPLKSEKREDFDKFHLVLKMMKAGDHLTTEGVNNVRRLAAQMNRGRSR